MEPSRDKRIMHLVHRCAELPTEDRTQFLASECAGDPDLITEVEAIIAADGSETGIHPSSERLASALPKHYRLLELIGSGGMAEVFLAEDTRLHRKIAIKFLNDTFRSDPERMLRFNREARSASALNHPNIITIHDIGESDGVQYIVSEYIDGETLASRMTRGRLPLAEALEIACQIASALDASHKAGIVHRDLKPENIMLRRDGGLKVVDFGLAKGGAVLGHHADTLELLTTSPGMILGTPRYMSPEQTRGLPLDGRSDIFSFGIILFEMVTGRTPFPGTNAADTIAAILGKEPRRLADFMDDPPQTLVGIVDRCLQKDREARYRSMAALLADLRELQSATTGPVRVNQTADLQPTGPLRPYAAYALALILVVLVAGGVWFFWKAVDPHGPAVATVGALRNIPITSWSSVSAEAGSAASFSPDARMVAFASTKSGASEIWSKPTVGGEPIQVTRNGFYNQYPVWSPDGQELAFYSSRGSENGIWRVSFTGGQEKQVTGGGPYTRPLRWTKDQRLFLQQGNDIYEIDLTSAEKKQLTDLNTYGIKARGLAVASDGLSFAISVKEAGSWKVKTARFGSKTLTDVASSNDQVDDIAFDNDNVTVYFTGGSDGMQQIFRSGPSVDSPVQVSSGNSDFSLQDVSADGSKVLYSSIAETSDLWLVSTTDGKATVFANDVPLEYWPEVSPDGKSVVYESVQQADRPFRGSIMLKRTTSTDPPVTISPDGFSPVWSSDGAWVAFFRRTDAGISIWRARSSGNDLKQIAAAPVTAPGYVNPPYLKSGLDHISVSPDGSQIAFAASRPKGFGLVVASVDGSSVRDLITSDDPNERFCCAKWTADGRSIVTSSDTKNPQGTGTLYRLWLIALDGSAKKMIYESKRELRCLGFTSSGEIGVVQRSDLSDSIVTPASVRIWTIPLGSGQPQQIAQMAGAYFNNIRISRDGSTIAYVTRAKENTELFTTNLARGLPKPIFAENDPKVLISSFAWFPDGKSIVLGKQTRTNVLSMLTN
jgi:serine/threonine protein kinase